uniref:Uncharacterized protein n=1 Tax=viral metagenome TaxID=1070528 RepID=A0A6M3XX33_9ZZZZ
MGSDIEERIMSLLDAPEYKKYHAELRDILTDLECGDIDGPTAEDLLNNSGAGEG